MADDTQRGDVNPRFELAVLGAALTNEEAWDPISRQLSSTDFYIPSHAQLFDEIVRAEEEARWGDVDLIAQALVDGGAPDGYEIIANAVSSAAPMGTLEHYVTDLRGRSKTRQTALVNQTFQLKLADVGGDSPALAAILAEHEDALRTIAEDVSDTPWDSMGDLLKKVEQGDTRTAAHFPTGFPDLDKVLQGGFRPRQMVTVAGRPAMGKTTICTDFARYASFRRDIPGLFVSLEMSAEELATRIAAAEGAIPLNNLTNGDLSDEDRARVSEVREKLEDSPLHVLDAESSEWGSIRAAIASAHRRVGIQYAIIDYLQLVTLEEKARSSRDQEVGAISRGIKMLAKQLGITIIAVAQLNRGVEQRSGNIPVMSDLRESGTIEQDSDIVALVHRPDYYDQMSERAGEADLIIAKQRNGPTGTASFSFQGHYSRFMSLAHQSDSYAAESYPEA